MKAEELGKNSNISTQTEIERMTQNGRLLYNDKLIEIHTKAFEFQTRYNVTIDQRDRVKMLRTMLGGVGDTYDIRPYFMFQFGQNIFIGDYCYINHGCVILDTARVTIGSKTILGPNVQLLCTDHDKNALNGGDRSKELLVKPITIGENSWIGGGAIILPGVTIGDNVTIGAGSVVTKSIPSNTVAFGVPCKVVEVLENAETPYPTSGLTKDKLYPLSSPQKSMFALEAECPGTSIGNIAGTMQLEGPLDFRLLEKAINIFIANNDTMRIRVVREGSELRQYVEDYKYESFDFFDFSEPNRLQDLYRFEKEKTREPFNLMSGCLYYFAFLKTGNNENGIYLKIHHSISDAWSISITISDILDIYLKLLYHQDVSYGKKPSYLDYVESEIKYRNSQKFEKDRLFWQKKFKTVPECNCIKEKPELLTSTKDKRKTVTVYGKLVKDIIEYCHTLKVSAPSLFIAALALYMNKITAKKDVVILIPILNRWDAKGKETLGMFAGEIPIRIKIDDTMSSKEFTSMVFGEIIDCFRHAKYPYELIQKDFEILHRTGRNIHQMFISYQNAQFSDEIQALNFKSRWHKTHQRDSLLISVNDREGKGEFILDLDYLEGVFSEKDIEETYRGFLGILAGIIGNQDVKIRDIVSLDMGDIKNK